MCFDMNHELGSTGWGKDIQRMMNKTIKQISVTCMNKNNNNTTLLLLHSKYTTKKIPRCVGAYGGTLRVFCFNSFSMISSFYTS